jgi:hypothetical protein
MGATHHKPARVIFLVAGIVLVFMGILSSGYAYSYFENHLQLGPDGPLIIFETTIICTVLGLLGGFAIGTYIEAWRAKKGES